MVEPQNNKVVAFPEDINYHYPKLPLDLIFDKNAEIITMKYISKEIYSNECADLITLTRIVSEAAFSLLFAKNKYFHKMSECFVTWFMASKINPNHENKSSHKFKFTHYTIQISLTQMGVLDFDELLTFMKLWDYSVAQKNEDSETDFIEILANSIKSRTLVDQNTLIAYLNLISKMISESFISKKSCFIDDYMTSFGYFIRCLGNKEFHKIPIYESFKSTIGCEFIYVMETFSAEIHKAIKFKDKSYIHLLMCALESGEQSDLLEVYGHSIRFYRLENYLLAYEINLYTRNNNFWSWMKGTYFSLLVRQIMGISKIIEMDHDIMEYFPYIAYFQPKSWSTLSSKSHPIFHDFLKRCLDSLMTRNTFIVAETSISERFSQFSKICKDTDKDHKILKTKIIHEINHYEQFRHKYA